MHNLLNENLFIYLFIFYFYYSKHSSYYLRISQSNDQTLTNIRLKFTIGGSWRAWVMEVRCVLEEQEKALMAMEEVGSTLNTTLSLPQGSSWAFQEKSYYGLAELPA